MLKSERIEIQMIVFDSTPLLFNFASTVIKNLPRSGTSHVAGLTFRVCHILFHTDVCLHIKLSEVTNNLVLEENYSSQTQIIHTTEIFGS